MQTTFIESNIKHTRLLTENILPKKKAIHLCTVLAYLHITSTLHETASQADFANWCYQVINHANNTFRSVPSKPFNSYKVAHTHYCPLYGGGVTTNLQKQDVFKRKLHLDTDKLFVIRDKLGSYQLPCFSSPGHTMVCR